MEGPMRTRLRAEAGGPECARSVAGGVDPRRTKLRTGVVGPKLTWSGAGSEDTGPRRARPRSGTQLPGRPGLRSGSEESGCVRSGTDVIKPMRAELLAGDWGPSLTRSGTGSEDTEPGRAMPRGEAADPGRARLRAGGGEPK